MENLENMIKNGEDNGRVTRGYDTSYNGATKGITPIRNYSVFSEQYLENPVASGDTMMAMSPTACTIKAVPVIDDF